jgi:hypothetical protein
MVLLHPLRSVSGQSSGEKDRGAYDERSQQDRTGDKPADRPQSSGRIDGLSGRFGPEPSGDVALISSADNFMLVMSPLTVRSAEFDFADSILRLTDICSLHLNRHLADRNKQRRRNWTMPYGQT